MNDADNDNANAGMAETKAPASQPPAPLSGDAIEAWVREFFHDSIVSRETAIFNHVRMAVDTLKSRHGL